MTDASLPVLSNVAKTKGKYPTETSPRPCNFCGIVTQIYSYSKFGATIADSCNNCKSGKKT